MAMNSFTFALMSTAACIGLGLSLPSPSHADYQPAPVPQVTPTASVPTAGTPTR